MNLMLIIASETHKLAFPASSYNDFESFPQVDIGVCGKCGKVLYLYLKLY